MSRHGENKQDRPGLKAEDEEWSASTMTTIESVKPENRERASRTGGPGPNYSQPPSSRGSTNNPERSRWPNRLGPKESQSSLSRGSIRTNKSPAPRHPSNVSQQRIDELNDNFNERLRKKMERQQDSNSSRSCDDSGSVRTMPRFKCLSREDSVEITMQYDRHLSFPSQSQHHLTSPKAKGTMSQQSSFLTLSTCDESIPDDIHIHMDAIPKRGVPYYSSQLASSSTMMMMEEAPIHAVAMCMTDQILPIAMEVGQQETEMAIHKRSSCWLGRALVVIGLLLLSGAAVAIGLVFGKQNSPDPSLVQGGRSKDPKSVSQSFLQTYKGRRLREMTDERIDSFERLIASYTEYYGTIGYVTTVCTVNDQTVSNGRNLNVFTNTTTTTTTTATTEEISMPTVDIYFTVTYISAYDNTDIKNYPFFFEYYMNSEEGNGRVISDLQSIGVAVEEATNVVVEKYSTSSKYSPTVSPIRETPTHHPSSRPTVSFSPTLSPRHQIGQTLKSPGYEAWFGDSVSLSRNGQRVAVGGAKYSGPNGQSGFSRGLVEVYDVTQENQWNIIGELHGRYNGDWFGRSVSLTANGDFLAVGAAKHHEGNVREVGLVEIHQISQGNITKRGQTIYGQGENSRFGGHVSLSDDGKRLAVGAFFYAQVYEFNESNNEWDQLGNNIGGRDWSRVSMSRDGNYVAVSFRFDDRESANDGVVQIWEYSSMAYSFTQVGQNLVGLGKDHRFGADVSLSFDGQRVAIGSEGGNYVRVFHFNRDTKMWLPLGDQINGNDDDDAIFGHRLSLSADGTVLAIGSPFYNFNGIEDMGRVAIYQLNDESGQWEQSGRDIKGGTAFVNAGKGISISPDGGSLAVGTPSMNNEGIVQIFMV